MTARKSKLTLWRSLLLVPAHVESMLQKALSTDADALILDFEDAVPDKHKPLAREVTQRFLSTTPTFTKTIFVRPNCYETGLTSDDLQAVCSEKVNGILYPWANHPEAIRRLDAELTGLEATHHFPRNHFQIIALIESPQAVLQVEQIARASRRLTGLLFGCEDFLAELEGRHDEKEQALLLPRALVAITARAVGLQPIDTPYIKIRDTEGLRQFATTGRALGMSGMSALNPDQVKIINEVYTPTFEQIQFAKEIVHFAESHRCQNRGVCVVGDKFISPPTVKAARKLLQRRKEIKRLEK